MQQIQNSLMFLDLNGEKKFIGKINPNIKPMHKEPYPYILKNQNKFEKHSLWLLPMHQRNLI